MNTKKMSPATRRNCLKCKHSTFTHKYEAEYEVKCKLKCHMAYQPCPSFEPENVEDIIIHSERTPEFVKHIQTLRRL